jgi:hypothetical protein
MFRPERGLGSINAEPPKKVLPQHVEIKGATTLSIATSHHASFYQEALQCLPLPRLQKIKQLSVGLIYDDKSKKIEPKSYETNRWDHTLEVTVLTEAILTQNGFSPKDVQLGIAAALLHDIATPAGGDGTMKVDTVALDEETNWDRVLDEKGKDFLAKHNLDPKVITKIIVNGGVFGQVLDIADRIAYVISDTHEIGRTEGNHDTDLLKQLAEHSTIGNIYQDVRVEGDQVYFDNPERLLEFLKLRALLRRDFCDNKFSLGRDVASGNLIRPHLEGGTLTPDMLRRMWDINLFDFLTKRNQDTWREGNYFDGDNGEGYQKAKANLSQAGLSMDEYYDPSSPRSLYYQISHFMPDVEMFYSADELQRRRKEIEDHNKNKVNKIYIIGEYEHPGFVTGAEYCVRNADGEIVSFQEFNPQKVGELEAIAEHVPGFYLFSKRAVRVNTTEKEVFSRFPGV